MDMVVACIYPLCLGTISISRGQFAACVTHLNLVSLQRGKSEKPFAIQRASQERPRPKEHYKIRRASAPP